MAGHALKRSAWKKTAAAFAVVDLQVEEVLAFLDFRRGDGGDHIMVSLL